MNKQSLAELLKIENDNINDILGKRERFAPGEQIIKFRSRISDKQVQSEFWFPKNPKYYPKNLHTKIIVSDNTKVGVYVQKHDQKLPVVPGSAKQHGPVVLTCAVTGAPAKYRDPLTNQPFANKEAFKIIREKYF